MCSAQSEPPLGDVARQTRDVRDQNKSRPTHESAEANRLAIELEEEQEEIAPAPEGFQTYRAEGYTVAIPAPLSVEGRNESGVLIGTAQVTGTNTKVFAANPIPADTPLNEPDFQELARRFWQRQRGMITCENRKPGVPVHRCLLKGELFGISFSGRASFVEGDNRIVPVVCFAAHMPSGLDGDWIPYTEHERNDPNLRMKNVDRSQSNYQSYQLCDSVLGSIHLSEEMVHEVKLPLKKAVKPSAAIERASDGSSLGELARQARQSAPTQAKAKLTVESEEAINRGPSGYRLHSEILCKQECVSVSFLLPENARRVKGGDTNNVYVDTLNDTTSLTIFFGETQGYYGGGNYEIARRLASTWLHAEPVYNSEEKMHPRDIDGQTVQVIRSRLRGNMTEWMEESLRLTVNDTDFGIGCIARQDRFADAESVCSTIFDSWRIRHQ